MFEHADTILAVLDEGRALAVATVTGVLGSAPRMLGTAMAVDETGAVFGSISGGCVEGAVYEIAKQVLSGDDSVLAEFGVSDDDAFAVGLSCGGTMQVFIQLADESLRPGLEAARAGRASGIALVVDGGAVSKEDRRRIDAELTARVSAGVTVLASVDCDGSRFSVLYLVSTAPPRLIIFGAVDFAAALTRVAHIMGYRITVCDARPVFATEARFSDAEVVVDWPHRYLEGTETDERTVICVLSHDEKFDIPVLAAALRLPVGFVGAMGSRRTDERRRKLLREAGTSEGNLSRLHSPIGLDIGASTPEETAVSILAEVLKVRTGASGESLRARSGPIHGLAALGAADGPGAAGRAVASGASGLAGRAVAAEGSGLAKSAAATDSLGGSR